MHVLDLVLPDDGLDRRFLANWTAATGPAARALARALRAIFEPGPVRALRARRFGVTLWNMVYFKGRRRDARAVGGIPSTTRRPGSPSSCAVAAVLDAIPGGPHEMVFVDDGSSDARRQAGEAARDPRILVVSLSRNFGHQAALTAALDHVTGDVMS